MRGSLALIVIFSVLFLAGNEIFLSSVFAGSSYPFCDSPLDTCFDNTGGDGLWTNPSNWNNGIPTPTQNAGIGYETLFGPLPPESAIIPTGITVDIDLLGSLTLISDTSLTIQNGAFLYHVSTDTVFVDVDSDIFVNGLMFNGDGALMTVDGKITIGDTGLLVNDLSTIDGNGEIECVGNGTFDQLGTVAGTITVTNCGGGAPVGSISIPLESTSMLVAGTENNSMWIALAFTAASIGTIFVVKRLKN